VQYYDSFVFITDYLQVLPTVAQHSKSNHTATTSDSNRVEGSSNPTVKLNENAASESKFRSIGNFIFKATCIVCV